MHCNADSTKSNKLQAGVTFSLNSNGISSVPAFSLGDPALMASASLGKGWFSYDPTLAYSLDGHPWFIDNWLHVKLIRKPKFELRTGMNISSYCSKYITPEEDLYQVERYFAFELAATFRFARNMSLLAQYWNDRGQEDTVAERSFSECGCGKNRYGHRKTCTMHRRPAVILYQL